MRRCPSCGIELRADNSGPLCSCCFGMVASHVVNNLPYWEAIEVAERDAMERLTHEKQRLMRADEDFLGGKF